MQGLLEVLELIKLAVGNQGISISVNVCIDTYPKPAEEKEE